MITFSVLVLSICTCVLIYVKRTSKKQTLDGIKNAAPPVAPNIPATAALTANVAAGAGNSIPELSSQDSTSEAPSPLEQDRRLLERWRDWLALTTIIIGVMAAVMALEVSRFSTYAVLSAGKETNAWSYYQAKSVKEHTYQISKAALELQLDGTPGISTEAAEKYRKAIKKYGEEIKRYKDEKDEIQEQAIALGKTKDKYQKLSAGFNNSLVFLQIAIIMSSIATMVRKKYIWYVSLSMLIGWIYFIANCF